MAETSTKEVVETSLKVTGTAAFGGSMRVITGAASMAGAALTRLTSMAAPLSAVLGGIGAGITLSGIASVNSEFEETQRLIGGIYATMGVTSDFNSGLREASSTMTMITTAAARLPGEAQDYINVFQSALPAVRGAIQGSTQDMVGFTNSFTAVASTLGVNSVEAGMMLSRALASGRGMIDQQSVAFQTLLPFIMQATQGTAHQVTNATEFNKLTLEQRTNILQTTLAQEGLVAMLDDAGNSWNSQVGAITSLGQTLLRLGSAPLFDAMKDGLGAVNAMFMSSEGELTSMGETIVAIGNVLSSQVISGVTNLLGFLEQARGVASSMFGDLERSGILDTVMGFMDAATATGGSLVGSVMTGFQNVLDIISGAVGQLSPILTAVGSAADNLIPLYLATGNLLADFGRMVLPSVINVLSAFIEPVVYLYSAIYNIYTVLSEQLRPQFQSLWHAVSLLADIIANTVRPIFQDLGVSGGGVVELLLDQLVPALQTAVQTIANMIAAFARFLEFLSRYIPVGSGSSGSTPRAGGPSLLDQIRAAMAANRERQESESAAAGAVSRTPPHARGGAKVHQDFRHSRFDIAQKFAEGFDPDRIAVAFANDVGRIGEQRLQSGLEPMFGVR